MRKSATLQNIILIILSYLCTLSVGKLVSISVVPASYYDGYYFGYNLSSVLVFAVTYILLSKYIKLENKRLWVFTSLIGLLGSLLIVYGAYAHILNDIFIDAPTAFLQIGMIVGLNLFIAPLLAQLFLFAGRAENWWAEHTQDKFKRLPDQGFFLLCWLIIFVCYIPLFLSQWPGNFIFDSQYQLQDHYYNDHFTHHPLAHTLLMGLAYDLGIAIGNLSFGIQFYTLLQMLVLAGAFAFCCLYLYQKKAPKWFQIGTFLWFAIFPMHALFSISATKDVLFAAFFLVFFIFTVKFYAEGQTTWQVLLGLVLFGTLSALYRNNAIYAIFIAGVISIAFVKTWKKKIMVLALLVSIYVFSSLGNSALVAIADAKEHDSYKETLSVPLQCLARVVSYHDEELDPALKEEILLYIPEYCIPGYNPYLSDPIKTYASEEMLRTNTFNFFKLWAKVGLQFPDEYLESIITNTFGYWYPLNQGVYVSGEIALYHTLIGVGEEIAKIDYCPWATKLYNCFWSLEYRQIPILAFFFRNAPYVWLSILAIFMAWYKKNTSKFVTLLLPFFYLVTCFAGPMAALRYIYNIVVIVPVILCLLLNKSDTE